MWQWIVGTLKPGHALDRELGSPRALRRYIAGLSDRPPEAALEAVAGVFDATPQLGLAPLQRLQALCAVDDFAHGFRGMLAARLLGDSPKQVLCERTWNQLLQSYRALDAGYVQALAELDPAVSTAEAHALATVAACRAMHAMAKCNMLARMRYRDSAAALWPRIEQLIAALHRRAAASATVALYPDASSETSLVREYLVALLFEMAPTSNLLPAQIHAIDLLLRQYAAHFRMGESFDQAALPFMLDPAGDAKPKRWLPGLTARAGMRFFGLGDAYAHILHERERAQHARSTPEWLAPSQLSAELYRNLLDRLATQWALTPPMRRQRRETVAGEVLVAHDFAQMRRLIGFSELARTGRSLEYDRFSAYTINGMVRGSNDAQLRAPNEQKVSADEALRNLETFERALEEATVETWKVVDTSDDGLGAEVMGKAAWAKAGMLVAYRRPDCAHWLLAVVRRLHRQANGILRIGMHKLPGIPYCARVSVNDGRQPSTDKPHSGPVLHYDAIKLAGGEGSLLLLPPGVFDPSWRYTLTVGHRWDFIRMQRVSECGLDFEQVAFEAVQAQQAA